MLNKLILRCLPYLGRKRLQPFYEQLLRLALSGLHMGMGAEVGSSGEVAVFKRLRQAVGAQTPLVFDVGANVGEYCKALLSEYGQSVEVNCFEPSHSAFTTLKNALGSYSNVKLHNLGFSDQNTPATLYADSPGSGLSSVFARRLNHFGIELRHQEEIRLSRLDDFCAENNISYLHLLKLDVEGNELNVLHGAQGMLQKQAIALIQFEFGGCNIDSRTFFQDFYYLLTPGYRICRIVHDGLIPIDQYKEIYEIFKTTNYLAISRKLPAME
jgi:FkbM family methyltransferase